MMIAMKIERHISQEDQEIIKIVVVDIMTTVNERTGSRTTEVEGGEGHTPDHHLDHNQDHLAAKRTGSMTDRARLDAHLTVPNNHEKADGGQLPQRPTRTHSKPSSARFHLAQDPPYTHAAEPLSKPTT